MQQPEKPLPIAVTSFDTMIDGNYIYVDKTDLIASLAQHSYPYFFARPRRFGKSTLVNTFKELFTNGLEKFRGLKIEQDGLYTDTKTYKVLHLNFSKCTEDGNFKEYLLDLLTTEFKRNGLDFDDQLKSPASLIESVVSREENRSIVLLIDEYDSPLTVVLDNEPEFAKRSAILRAFYCAIKDISDRFRFCFITGISRYCSKSIFSGLNNLVDLSLNPRYGTLLGYTQAELECYFGDYIEFAACQLNQVANAEQHYRYESVLHLLKQYYGGYCFDELALTRVYNPWSILNFLNSPGVGFVNYWRRSGPTKPPILVKYLGQQVGAGLVYKQFLDLNQTIEIEADSLAANMVSQDSREFSFVPVLYQAGYLTIKDADGGDLTLGLPNIEIKRAFSAIILELLKNKSPSLGAEFKKTLKLALKPVDMVGG